MPKRKRRSHKKDRAIHAQSWMADQPQTTGRLPALSLGYPTSGSSFLGGLFTSGAELPKEFKIGADGAITPLTLQSYNAPSLIWTQPKTEMQEVQEAIVEIRQRLTQLEENAKRGVRSHPRHRRRSKERELLLRVEELENDAQDFRSVRDILFFVRDRMRRGGFGP